MNSTIIIIPWLNSNTISFDTWWQILLAYMGVGAIIVSAIKLLLIFCISSIRSTEDTLLGILGVVIGFFAVFASVLSCVKIFLFPAIILLAIFIGYKTRKKTQKKTSENQRGGLNVF